MAELNPDEFRVMLQANVEQITGSDCFCSLYSQDMGKFMEDPLPAIQLAIAILLDKPIILAVRPGPDHQPPAKLMAIADAVVYGDGPYELGRGIREAAQRLMKGDQQWLAG